MNYVTISGKIVGDIVSELDKEMRCCKFKLKNLYYSPTKTATEVTIVRCIAYGGLAEYIYNEMYEGCDVVITGRVLHRHYVSNNTAIDVMYIGCNTVSKLEQGEYV